MKIKELSITKFKSIDDIYINTDNLVSIVGKNNYGKTAIFDAIQVFFRKRKFTEKDIHMFSSEELPVISITFQQIDTIDLQLLLESSINRKKAQDFYNQALKKREVQITLFFEKDNDKYKGWYVFEENQERIPPKTIEEFLPDLKYISSIRNPEDNSFSKKSSNISQLMEMLIGGNKKRDNNEEVIIDGVPLKISDVKKELKKLEDEKVKLLSYELSNKFQEIIGNQSLSIEIQADQTDIIHLHKTKIRDHDILNEAINSFDIESSGTGMQSLLIIAILEAYIEHTIGEQDFILIIEEPEVYLHPSLQRKIINILRELSISNQVFISTHSPVVVSQLAPQELICIKKERGITKKLSSDPIHIISELGIKPDDIFQHTKILFVEGPDDKKLIKSILQTLMKYKKIKTDLLKVIQIIEVGGIDTLGFYTNARILDVMNKAHHNNYKFWILVDSDGNTKNEVKTKIEKSLSEFSYIYNKDNAFILEEYSIESYFIDENILCFLFDHLDKEKTAALCRKYFEIYNRGKAEKNKIGKSQFQNRYKPKNFFSAKEEIFYKQTWGLSNEEIKLLNEIQRNWNTTNIDLYIEQFPLELIEGSKLSEFMRCMYAIEDQI
ncbi:hypothetical protein AC622_03130 [Bacillus sp. FJAT-27916]|uniref:ATP-dependent nuclease n=1 Tax=Bacillus sp. FJAT-27916 TaxID=1679169 RepID=UPI000670F3E0|nr:AAA family ATPase [Bacillus sp. FJAT-27916]KMY43372.1 hypothetical protein AC622_03130 [Bacillus sp. FJAT-27916]